MLGRVGPFLKKQLGQKSTAFTAVRGFANHLDPFLRYCRQSFDPLPPFPHPQGCTLLIVLSPNLFQVYINDMIVAVEAAKQGVTRGEDTASGLMFADDFVTNIRSTRRIAGTDREGTTIEYTRKWRVTASVKKCAVVVCIDREDKVNPATFKWKWGKDGLPAEIVDQYALACRDILRTALGMHTWRR